MCVVVLQKCPLITIMIRMSLQVQHLFHKLQRGYMKLIDKNEVLICLLNTIMLNMSGWFKKTDTVFVCFLPHWRYNLKETLQPLPVLSVDLKASGIPALRQKQLLPACSHGYKKQLSCLKMFEFLNLSWWKMSELLNQEFDPSFHNCIFTFQRFFKRSKHKKLGLNTASFFVAKENIVSNWPF